MGRQHFNGLKTAALFGGLWALLLAIGWVLGRGSPKYVPLFAGLALAPDAIGDLVHRALDRRRITVTRLTR